ncbi:hypothetical protein [Phenylobacterium sp.]|uniref:hypothetical protein n=1 Tax=Phenylobacterium sp. TaxID=1871053 RepID=UPI0025D89339|nr:hypothetical protein [Phenylobacterium sp.]
MNPNIERLKLIFIALFAVAVVGVLVWQIGWIVPQKKCEGAHKWWDPSSRVCAQPVLISDITGKTIQDKTAEAAAKRAIGRPVGPTPAPAPK